MFIFSVPIMQNYKGLNQALQKALAFKNWWSYFVYQIGKIAEATSMHTYSLIIHIRLMME